MNPIILTDNRFRDGAPVASATAADYSALFIADERPYTFWQAPAVGTYTIKVDCATAKSADTLALCGHNLATIGATVSIESSADDATWTTRLAAFAPTTDYALMRLFTSASARHWRLTITAPAGVPMLAIAFLGVRMEIPARPDSPYIPIEQDVTEETSLSEAGYPLGTVIKFKSITTKPAFSQLSRTWVFETFRPVWDSYISERRCFFWAWDLTTYANDYVFFSQHIGKYNPSVTILSIVDKLQLELRCWR